MSKSQSQVILNSQVNRQDLVKLGNESSSFNKISNSQSTDENLPHGQLLVIDIKSTWGDEFYVGLNGIEVFDERGMLLWKDYGISEIKLKKTNEDSDNKISLGNSLVSQSISDSKKIENLIDGINLTHDDHHVWLMPYEKLQSDNNHISIATIEILFTEIKKISKIRIFNYNKSRTHSYRGVRKCCIQLDGTEIYHGYE
jgi:hypothetical protein